MIMESKCKYSVFSLAQPKDEHRTHQNRKRASEFPLRRTFGTPRGLIFSKGFPVNCGHRIMPQRRAFDAARKILSLLRIAMSTPTLRMFRHAAPSARCGKCWCLLRIPLYMATTSFFRHGAPSARRGKYRFFTKDPPVHGDCQFFPPRRAFGAPQEMHISTKDPSVNTDPQNCKSSVWATLRGGQQISAYSGHFLYNPLEYTLDHTSQSSNSSIPYWWWWLVRAGPSTPGSLILEVLYSDKPRTGQ